MKTFRASIEDYTPPPGKGTVIINPPYGERMGEEESMIPLYKMIGDFMKQKCAGYKGYVFTGNFEAAKFIGLKPKSRKLFYNAKNIVENHNLQGNVLVVHSGGGLSLMGYQEHLLRAINSI